MVELYADEQQAITYRSFWEGVNPGEVVSNQENAVAGGGGGIPATPTTDPGAIPNEVFSGETFYGCRMVGGILEKVTFRSSSVGARVEILPERDTTIGFVSYAANGSVVFETFVSGTDSGDVIIGNYAGGAGARWSQSAGTFYIAGGITATYGTIGGCVITATTISSTTFVSGPLGYGWQINSNGTAEFQNVIVRGTIRTSVFEKDTISAVNGLVLISKADVLASDMTALDSSTLTISGETAFVANEVIRIKDGTDDEWLLVTDASSAPIYTVTRDLAGAYSANANPIWKKGTAVVSMGVGSGTKTGFVLFDASSANSPYIDIYGRNSNTYSDYTIHGRFGWLKGIVDTDVGLNGTDVWGLYTDNGYFKGTIYGTTITGGTFRTGTSGQRIRIITSAGTTPTQQANSIGLIDSSDRLIFDVGSTSGVIQTIQLYTDAVALNIANNSGLALSSALIGLTVNNASSSAKALDITTYGSGDSVEIIEAGSGRALRITKHTDGSAGEAVEINQQTAGITLELNKTNIGAGVVLDINNSGTGHAVDILCSANARALNITTQGLTSGQIANNFYNTGYGQAMQIYTDNASNSDRVLMVATEGSGYLIDTNKGGYCSNAGKWIDSCSKTRKEDFIEPDFDSIVEKIKRIKLFNYKYKHGQNSERYMTPMSEEIYELFGIGRPDGLSGVDLASLALIGVQYLLNKE